MRVILQSVTIGGCEPLKFCRRRRRCRCRRRRRCCRRRRRCRCLSNTDRLDVKNFEMGIGKRVSVFVWVGALERVRDGADVRENEREMKCNIEKSQQGGKN